MTDALATLRAQLEGDAERMERPLTADTRIDEVLSELSRRLKATGSAPVPRDLQLEAIQRFWEALTFSGFAEARLVCHGLALAPRRGAPPLIEDSERFLAVLRGLEQFASDPRRFRRCYLGLTSSYFAYDGQSSSVPRTGSENWRLLRQYLSDHVGQLTDQTALTPNWVDLIKDNAELFSSEPCATYAQEVLAGDLVRVDRVCQEFAISDASWFLRELVLAQVAYGTSLSDKTFDDLLPELLKLLRENEVVRDHGLGKLLNRYAERDITPVHKELRDHAITWWGNPWLQSNRMRWGGVETKTREMVADWLKLEFLEAFFTILAEDGFADQRRLKFWKRYVHAIDHVQFALGADARSSRDPEMAQLRKKMTGLSVSLVDQSSASNAFILHIGNWVLVEFSGRANALYGYNRKKGIPFDAQQAVTSAKDAHNSLKSSRRVLWMKHGDNQHGYSRWEQRFAATLRQSLGVEPLERMTRVAQRTPFSVASPVPYSERALQELAKGWGALIDDRRRVGGSLWVKAPATPEIERVLAPWGFQFKAGKGWWK
jgi:hypothetical protein